MQKNAHILPNQEKMRNNAATCGKMPLIPSAQVDSRKPTPSNYRPAQSAEEIFGPFAKKLKEDTSRRK